MLNKKCHEHLTITFSFSPHVGGNGKKQSIRKFELCCSMEIPLAAQSFWPSVLFLCTERNEPLELNIHGRINTVSNREYANLTVRKKERKIFFL